MKITPEIAALIAQLEYEIGRECYNPNSYDGYTGECPKVCVNLQTDVR